VLETFNRGISGIVMPQVLAQSDVKTTGIAHETAVPAAPTIQRGGLAVKSHGEMRCRSEQSLSR